MANRDIVNQLTDEMGMNQQMLQNMQHQQLSQMPMGGGAMDFGGADQQQMMMMQQAMQQQQQQGAPRQPPTPDYDDSSSITSSSSGSVEMDLDKLGLNVAHNKGFMDNILDSLRDPIIVVVIFVLINLTQVDALLKSVIPYTFSYGMYFIGIKGVLIGLVFLAIKLVLG